VRAIPNREDGEGPHNMTPITREKLCDFEALEGSFTSFGMTMQLIHRGRAITRGYMLRKEK